MSQNSLEVEVQGVDENAFVHQEVFLSESHLFGGRFVGFHDRVESSWHFLLISFVDVIDNDLQLR